ncbi:hypothetical protein O6H91_09G032700 [Diphasiastrum complanatum]|uniref:Uncharacterized protein n=1 Tax=Diphasiastrum complanatum TaxID=34168 RepID=A0ACC2CMT5_DIPCM|nr:hypothetical protein O6H91_09G032700 [Diphasiastrum complanatum]
MKIGICLCSNQVMVTATSPSLPQQQQQQQQQQPVIKLIPSPKLRKRSQWSRGDGPGEYGGPPLDTRLRQYYGQPAPDPLTTSGDYIWNKNWQPYVDKTSSLAEEPATTSKITDSETGFLSFNRAISLDSMDIDLSQELMKPSKATLQRQVETARRAAMLNSKKKADFEKSRFRFAPTRREEAQWERARKAVSGGIATVPGSFVRLEEDPIQQKQRYMQLKSNLQLFTLAIGAVGVVSAWVIYTPDIVASYGVGLLGAVAYIRMLGNSVDAFGSRDAGGVVRGAIGQPRLLVPVLLVMIYNRWNEILVPEYGAVHLQLIPMLVGFFTYKLATVIEVLRDMIPYPEYENKS